MLLLPPSPPPPPLLLPPSPSLLLLPSLSLLLLLLLLLLLEYEAGWNKKDVCSLAAQMSSLTAPHLFRRDNCLMPIGHGLVQFSPTRKLQS